MVKRVQFVIYRLILPVEVGRGNYVTSATAKVKIWRIIFGFFAGKRRLLFLGGTEAISEGGTEGLD